MVSVELFGMIQRPLRATQDRSSEASDGYKRHLMKKHQYIIEWEETLLCQNL
ncbi:hypothetical protein [Clostridioides difficile]|uniref:hypothetical protein n=1 Tax=Clostridioides difficile TaxID=1496 RepID=UPI001596FACB|nr:hypothetical protein [Clostridioides difficile]